MTSSAIRIAVVSDTHDEENGQGLPGELIEAVQGFDLIFHCGDLENLGVLDRLEKVATVLAVRGYRDPFEPGDRLAGETRVAKVAGLRIGMVHDLRWPGSEVNVGQTLEFPPGSIQDLMKRKFGQRVGVVCFGDTHEEYIGWHEGILFINPGSPTYPGLRHPRGELGTLAYLDIKNGVASAKIIKL